MIRLIYKWFLRFLTGALLLLAKIGQRLFRKKKPLPDDGIHILVTGTFYSDQWLVTHLVPLALADNVNEVVMVADRPVPPMDKVRAVYPPGWLTSLVGGVGARTLLFLRLGFFGNYHFVAGFHLLLNGMFATLIASYRRNRSMYFCGGGPREVIGGGFETQNKIYGRLQAADSLLERMLVSFVKHTDLVVCMGSSAKTFFRNHGVESRIEIVPGGFDGASFYPARNEAQYDLVLVGRLSGVKRIDLFLEVVNKLNETRVVTALIVGDGPSREALEDLAASLGVEQRVTFAGWQQEVGTWLRKARIFVLTSESEGLSQALIQAFMCGLPAVVSDVGDLGDIVSDGANGHLVKQLAVTEFSKPIEMLLEDPAIYRQFSLNAVSTARQYLIPAVAKTWPAILTKDGA